MCCKAGEKSKGRGKNDVRCMSYEEHHGSCVVNERLLLL